MDPGGDDAQIQHFDRSFRAHPLFTYLHVVPGGLGRVLMIGALASAAAGLFFGLFMPYGGWLETLLIVIVGLGLIITIGRGFFAIRHNDVTQHREWLLRTFAICAGISTARLVAIALDLAAVPLSPRDGFIVSIWRGWILSLTVTEFWIRATRDATATGFVTYGS